MEKIKHIPLGLFCLYSVKFLVLPANFADVGLVLMLGLMSAFIEMKFESKESKELKKKLEEFSKSMSENASDIKILQNHFSSMKLAQNYKVKEIR